MRRIEITGQYKKDLKLARKRNLPEDKLNQVIFKLANDEPLPEANKDHALHGDYEGTRECHISPDWLLIYIKSDDDSVKVVTLVRTGTHSDLFLYLRTKTQWRNPLRLFVLFVDTSLCYRLRHLYGSCPKRG